MNVIIGGDESPLFPNSIKWLRLIGEPIRIINNKNSVLPKSLEILEISDDIEIEDGALLSINNTLHTFKVVNEKSFNQDDCSSIYKNFYSPLPNSLKCLVIDSQNFNQFKPNEIPSSVTSLEFGNKFSHFIKLPNIIPNNVLTLKILNQIIKISVPLPNSIITLFVNYKYDIIIIYNNNNNNTGSFIVDNSNFKTLIKQLEQLPNSIRIINKNNCGDCGLFILLDEALISGDCGLIILLGDGGLISLMLIEA
ncbi:hypothetical protein ACTFIY_008787 [Dictyostelium cf. discoideum]